MGPVAPSTVALAPIPPIETATSSVETLKAQVSADHLAIASAQKQRKTTLSQLLATRHSDAAALLSAKHQLMLAGSATSTQEFRASVVDLNSLVTQLTQTIHADTIAIVKDNHSDFSGIHSARQQLAADVRSLVAALHKH